MTFGQHCCAAPYRRAGTPWRFAWPAWRAVLQRSREETFSDNIDLMSAGVAFYGFLALVPMLGAIVIGYGLLATPDSVMSDVRVLTRAIPGDAGRLIGQQLLNIVTTSSGKKGLALAMALALALFGVRSGAGATITALNVAYEEKETRGFFQFNLIALAVSVTGILFALIGIGAVAALARLQARLWTMTPALSAAEKAGSYLAIMLGGGIVAAALYRIAPCRRFPGWIWVTPGAVLTGAGWLLVTLGFSSYVANIGHYNATYGSLGAVVVILTWFYLSSFILLAGAELNSECERQASLIRPGEVRRDDTVAGDVGAVASSSPGRPRGSLEP